MKKIIFSILAISAALVSCVGKKCSATVEEAAYQCPEIEELLAPVKRHDRW